MEHSAKRIMAECNCGTRHFQGRGGFMELGHFNKHFAKNTRKKYILQFLLLDTLKATV